MYYVHCCYFVPFHNECHLVKPTEQLYNTKGELDQYIATDSLYGNLREDEDIYLNRFAVYR